MNFKSFVFRLSGLAGVLTLLILGAGAALAETPQLSSPTVIKPALRVSAPPARLRTPREMKAAAARQAQAPPSAVRRQPYYTRVGATAYRELKAKVAPPNTVRQEPAPSRSAAPRTAVTGLANFDGVDSTTAGYYPPDTHGAAGFSHFVEVTNSHLDMYDKAAPNTLVGSIATDAWLGAATGTLANPRMVYDPVYDRWIFVATQLRESADVQNLCLAVSLTGDPTGEYYIYYLNLSAGPDTFWAFPQLGMDRDSIIITGDLYNGATYWDSRMFPVAKYYLYNGLGFDVPLFAGLVGTLAPSIVLDENPNTYLAAADYFTSPDNVYIYTLTNSASSPALTVASIPVAAFSLPPYAPQPGSSYVLDTMDARFANAGTQIGDSIFQVHTIDVGGYATPRFYEFDAANLQVLQNGDFYGSSTSFDFNASIAANGFKDVFVTWSSTDPTNNVNAEVRFSGRLHTDPTGVIASPGSLLYGSAAALSGNGEPPGSTFQRWGEYSAVSLDPADANGATAWIVNERILDADTWGSRIGSISFGAGPVAGSNSIPAIQILLLSD